MGYLSCFKQVFTFIIYVTSSSLLQWKKLCTYRHVTLSIMINCHTNGHSETRWVSTSPKLCFNYSWMISSQPSTHSVFFAPPPMQPLLHDVFFRLQRVWSLLSHPSVFFKRKQIGWDTTREQLVRQLDDINLCLVL